MSLDLLSDIALCPPMIGFVERSGQTVSQLNAEMLH